MAKTDDFTTRNALARKVAKSAMQERLGQTSDIDAEIESLEKLLEAEEQSYMGRGTPPPDYLPEGARQVWVELLHNAVENHFKQTEYDTLAQYCWLVAGLRIHMRGSSATLDDAELRSILRMQIQVRALSVRLRLSPQVGVAIKVTERIDSARAAAESMRNLVNGKSGRGRSGLMFGEGSDELQ